MNAKTLKKEKDLEIAQRINKKNETIKYWPKRFTW